MHIASEYKLVFIPSSANHIWSKVTASYAGKEGRMTSRIQFHFSRLVDNTIRGSWQIRKNKLEGEESEGRETTSKKYFHFVDFLEY